MRVAGWPSLGVDSKKGCLDYKRCVGDAQFVYGVRLGELDKYAGVWKDCIFQVQETCILLWACVVAKLIKRHVTS
jgi:hypothetical protein